jgi:hypothetical protein
MTEYEVALKNYIEQLAALQRSISRNNWIYHSVEEIVLEIGQFDIVRPLPKSIKRGRMGLCFQNAFRLMEQGFIYVEGIAVPGGTGFPVHHGWCVDQFNNVLDPTWKDGVAYLGIHLNKMFIYQRILQRRKYGVFDNIEARDLYENGLPADALAKNEACVISGPSK